MASRILITGCAGFIGSHLSEALLSQGHEVVGIDNFDPFYSRAIKERNLSISIQHPLFTFREIDLVSRESLDELQFRPDLVIHLAGKAGVRPSIDHPEDYVQANIVGTLNLLNWMHANGLGKMVFASSSSVYGNNKKVPFDESDDVDSPISPYAFTKRACEMQNHVFHSLFGMSFINLRFFTVYGQRQRPDLAIRKFTSKILKGEVIQVYGNGSTYRDYTHVSDIVRGIELAVARIIGSREALFETFNLGNSSPVSLMDLIRLIELKSGIKAKIEYLPAQPGDVDRTYASLDKSTSVLGYLPFIPLEEGLGNFVAWMKEGGE